MKKLSTKQQLKVLVSYPVDVVVKPIEAKMDILDESYGVDRNVEEDLGGYVCSRNKSRCKKVKIEILKGIIA